VYFPKVTPPDYGLGRITHREATQEEMARFPPTIKKQGTVFEQEYQWGNEYQDIAGYSKPWLLLRGTVEGAKSFNQRTGIDPGHLPVREKFL